jgi:hypothetical protein
LSSNETGAGAITVDANNVYWVTQWGVQDYPTSGDVRQIANTGGTPITVANQPLSGNSGLNGIAVDSSNVYWTYTTEFAGSGIVKAPIGGGAPTTLSTVGIGYSESNIAINGSGLYFYNPSLTNTGTTAGIQRLSLDGQTLTTITSWNTTNRALSDLVIDSSYVYWTDAESQGVYRAPLAGGSPTALATGQQYVFGIAVSASNVFWDTGAGAGTAALFDASLSGGPPNQLSSLSNPRSLLTDGTYVYATNLGASTIVRIPIAGGAATTLATGVSAWYMALDATSLYFTSYSGVYQLTPR